MLERARQSWRAAGQPGRVVAAVSGGADSAALLMVLHALSQEAGFSLSAVHVDHGLRSESAQDAAFVADLCQRIHVPCRIRTVHVALPGEDGARQARYEALLAECQYQEADALALAHHRQDQAETVLLHLLRGSGSDGIAGMAECSSRLKPNGEPLLFWRPFLTVSPARLRAALAEYGMAWREDATNAQDGYLRNYLRHRVLPILEARVPRAQEVMARAARVLSDESSYFHEEARRFLHDNACLTPPCRWILYAPLRSLHPAMRRHALRQGCPVPLDYAQTEALMALTPGQTYNLPGEWRASCSNRYLHFLPPVAEPAAPGRLTCLPWQGETGDGIRRQAMHKAVFAQCALRYRQAGDVIHPLGGPGDKSLQDYWVDRHTERPFRPYLPLLCMGKRVIWSIGTGCAEECRVRPGDDAVLLCYEGYLPGNLPPAGGTD